MTRCRGLSVKRKKSCERQRQRQRLARRLFPATTRPLAPQRRPVETYETQPASTPREMRLRRKTEWACSTQCCQTTCVRENRSVVVLPRRPWYSVPTGDAERSVCLLPNEQSEMMLLT
jgi:hypothetical protein